jgi:hypothetical protein
LRSPAAAYSRGRALGDDVADDDEDGDAVAAG